MSPIEKSLPSVCMSVCVSPIVARQRFGKNPLIVDRQRLGRNVTAVTNTHATIEELLDASFSMWPVSYQGKYAISSSQNFLFQNKESRLKNNLNCTHRWEGHAVRKRARKAGWCSDNDPDLYLPCIRLRTFRRDQPHPPSTEFHDEDTFSRTRP
jgi:hypothetical protein